MLNHSLAAILLLGLTASVSAQAAPRTLAAAYDCGRATGLAGAAAVAQTFDIFHDTTHDGITIAFELYRNKVEQLRNEFILAASSGKTERGRQGFEILADSFSDAPLHGYGTTEYWVTRFRELRAFTERTAQRTFKLRNALCK
jgi:hypothetical protein